MFGRTFLFLSVLAAAVVVPYLLTNEPWLQSARSSWGTPAPDTGNAQDARVGWPAPREPIAPVTPPATGSPLVPAGWSSGPPATAPLARPLELPMLGGPPVPSLADILRMDVTPPWVLSNWRRVTTVVSSHNVEGLRVPLVTGTELHDLAGSLTYYFDDNQQVTRITFHGKTGDAGRLAAVVMERFDLRPEPAAGAGLYAARWNGRPVSVLRIRHAPIVRSDRPLERLDVALELNRPGSPLGISPEFQSMVPEHPAPARR